MHVPTDHRPPPEPADTDADEAPRPKSGESTAAYCQRTGAPPPKGLKLSVGPDGKTPVFVKAPRDQSLPWWRVKHPMYGSKEVQGKTEAEAIARALGHHEPARAKDKLWLESVAKECRTTRLPK